ncbi:L-lactate permease [Limnoglobus roseus]|uniref:L-lactate permease n=1 Tax=Limnoglobus roseus TaxID=2598579 RepID=A0A5C1A994_9BACT|nr:L-lactate permease [Limnoglobus roseus]QEL14382.1 L-lactate permease [Limnoglobus roseus]
MLFADLYTQNLDPLGKQLASTFVAALPVLVLFYLLVGRRWVASWAGAAGSLVAIALAVAVFHMPAEKAGMSFVYGAAFGLLPIGWTVFGAMLIYNLTVETGMFGIIRRSIGGLSGDARVQAVLIGFCFGALMEGAAGSGSPVAICGAMLAGLGVPPLRAAVICLIANTSPVCYGGLGTPVFVLSGVTGIPGDAISTMCGHQLPILSCLIPFYMVKVICTWRQTLQIWPALLVGGGSFAIFQYFFATMQNWIPGIALWPLTDVGGSIFSMISLALFLRFVWKPKSEWKFPTDATTPPSPETKAEVLAHDPHAAEALKQVQQVLGRPSGFIHAADEEMPLTAGMVAKAWSPFVVMAICLGVIGIVRQMEKNGPIDMGVVRSYYEIEIPTVHLEVERAGRLVKPGAVGKERLEKAIFEFKWLTAAGTPCVVAVLISALILRTPPRVLRRVFVKTFIQMKIPIPTIACMLGLSYVTKYAGMDATLGVAFAETGVFYPFFAPLLGWLGVFLTGTDAGSNALFGSLQKITATEVWNGHGPNGTGSMPLELDQAQVLLCTANSTGGVMGKMIDAQSICVATAGTNQIGKEADIFKAVIWHSIFLACIVGAMTAVQAFVPPFTQMVPKP